MGVSADKMSPNLTMVVHLTSPDGRYDGVYLRNYGTLRIRDELARLPGVGQAMLWGAGDYAMRVWIDPDQAAARGLTAGDIVRAIREQNVQVSAGQLGAPPTPQAGLPGVDQRPGAPGRPRRSSARSSSRPAPTAG
jgi:multidrug efflux pump